MNKNIPDAQTFNIEQETEMIRPFTVPNSSKDKDGMISPFTIDYKYAAYKEQEREKHKKENAPETKNTQISDPTLTRPFDYVCGDCVKIAEEMFPNNRDVAQCVAMALDQYVKEGGNQKNILGMNIHTIPGNLNFTLQLLRRVSYIYDASDGEVTEMFYSIGVTVHKANGIPQTFTAEVASDKVKDTAWLKKATNSLATLPRTKDDREVLDNMIQECIEEEAERELIYQRAGWRNVPGKGWRYVFSQGIVGEGNSSIHADKNLYRLLIKKEMLGTREVFIAAMEMADICRNQRTSMNLLIFMHMGLLTTLFDLASHAIDFSFMIIGPTNCRKTSMTTAVTKVFDREKLRADAEFATATSAGIEQTLGLYKDATVIVDDYKAGANLTQQREMNRKLDEVIRFYGDRVEKKRMLAFCHDQKKYFFPIGGNCVITGEFAPDAIESSMTRMFVTEIMQKDVDNKKLQRYQDNRWILPCHVYDFLHWVTDRFEACVAYISEKYPAHRNEKDCIVGRYSGMYATFMVTAEIIVWYAVERRYWSEQDAEEFLRKVTVGLITELELMEDRFRQRDKGTQILRILRELLRDNLIKPMTLNLESCKRLEEFYEDDERYFITTKYLRNLISDYGRDFPDTQMIVNTEEMISVLDRKGALDVIEKDGKRIRSRKLPIQRGNTKRYIYIKKESLNHLDEE